MTSHFGAFTHKGKVRDINEDSYLARNHVFAVADGLGGHLAGEIASTLALKEFEQKLETEDHGDDQLAKLKKAIETANLSVFRASRDPKHHGMATTLTGAIIVDHHLYLGHVGDSRAYLLRNQRLSRLTTDHSLVEEFVKQGQLTSDEAEAHPQRNLLTRALGTDPEVQIDLLSLTLTPGDRLLLSTDGLNTCVGEDDIAAIVSQAKHPQEICQELGSAANEKGGQDNITVVLVEMPEGK